MNKIVWKGSAITGPVPPVLVTCGNGEKTNVLAVAWTGIINSHPPMTYVSIRPQRHSYKLIDEIGEFVINCPSAELAKKTDLCGILTGAKVNKIEKCGFPLRESSAISVPLIEDCPLNLECRVTQKLELGTHTMFIAEIVAVQVDESLVDSKGKLNMQKADLMAFLHGEYYALGRRLGNIGFSVTKRNTNKRPVKSAKKK